MKINKELEHHVIVEFKRHNTVPVLLKETHGYINDIDDIVEYFKNLVEQQIIRLYSGNKELITKSYDGKINIKTFFKYYKINVTFEKSEKSDYLCGILPKSIFQSSNGNWECIPEINMTIKAKNSTNAMNIFSFSIGHELTHGYDLLLYAKKTNQDPWYSIDRNRYFNISKEMRLGVGNTQASAYILYRLNRMERNAYIAQLKQELLSMKDNIKDAKSAIEAIKKTNSYNKFLDIEKNIGIILTIDKKEVQEGLLSDLNNIMNKNFINYNQLVKYYSNRWRKWKQQYLSQASKIAYDIFASDKKNLWLDYGVMGNDNKLIKSN